MENSAGGRGLCPDDVIVPHPVCAAPYHCVKYVSLCCLPLQSRRLAQTYRECKTVCQPSRRLQAIWLCLFAVSFPFAENIFLFDFLFAPLLFCVPPAWLLGIHPSFPSLAVLQCVCNTFSGLFGTGPIFPPLISSRLVFKVRDWSRTWHLPSGELNICIAVLTGNFRRFVGFHYCFTPPGSGMTCVAKKMYFQKSPSFALCPSRVHKVGQFGPLR